MRYERRNLSSGCALSGTTKAAPARPCERVRAAMAGLAWEIVFVDDDSTDGTRAIVLDWQRRYPDRIRVLLQPRNVGGTRNMFAVEGAARGEFVAEIEGDDYWIDRSKLQRQVEALRACPEAVLCGARAYVWHDGADQPDRKSVV